VETRGFPFYGAKFAAKDGSAINHSNIWFENCKQVSVKIAKSKISNSNIPIDPSMSFMLF